MITFDEGKLRFTYRVAGIAIDSDRVLLQKVEGEDFWFLPGGRVELLELATETLKREMEEELNVEVRVGRLIWIVENFFYYDDKSHHEIGMYFLMAFPEDSPLCQLSEFPGKDNGNKLTCKWHHLDELENTALYPSFLQTALKRIPDTPEHIVHMDGKL